MCHITTDAPVALGRYINDAYTPVEYMNWHVFQRGWDGTFNGIVMYSLTVVPLENVAGMWGRKSWAYLLLPVHMHSKKFLMHEMKSSKTIFSSSICFYEY